MANLSIRIDAVPARNDKAFCYQSHSAVISFRPWFLSTHGLDHAQGDHANYWMDSSISVGPRPIAQVNPALVTKLADPIRNRLNPNRIRIE